ncbi:MAG: translation initiation factor IF-6 [Nanoarchaeota archaeon]|nr:translation initiation factor IF-6 [Nanoarchaeota archaeon]
MEFIKLAFSGDSNLGLYGFATETKCLLGFEPQNKNKIEKVLGVKVYHSTIAETRFAGILAVGNDNGLLVPGITEPHEIEKLKKIFSNVQVIDTKQTALGNLILCNDKGCLIAENLEKYKDMISKCLGVPVEVGTIAGLDIIGSAGKATNTGCLVHRDATDEEIKKIEEVLGVKVDVGTVNFGTPFIKAGVIVNSKGLVISEKSTGPEIDRCFEVFK